MSFFAQIVALQRNIITLTIANLDGHNYENYNTDTNT